MTHGLWAMMPTGKKMRITVIVFCVLFSMKSIAQDKVSLSAKLLTVYELVAKKDYEQALSEIREVLKEDSVSVNAYTFGGICYQQLGYYDSAISFYDIVIEKKPTEADPHFLKAECLYDLERYDEAMESVKKTLYYDNEYFKAHILEARIYQKKGNPEKAEEILMAVVGDKLYNIESRKLLADIYMELGDTTLALNVISQALSISPRDQESLLFRINILFKKEIYDQLIKDLNIYLDIKRSEPKMYFMRAMAYLNTGDTVSALRDFNDVIYFDNKNAMAFYFRGVARNSLYDRAGACEDLKKASSLDFMPNPFLMEHICAEEPPEEQMIEKSDADSLDNKSGN